MNDIELIKILEKEIGKKLYPISFSIVTGHFDAGYCLTDLGNAVGLNLSFLNLKCMPSTIFLLKELERLELNNCLIEEIPDEIKNLKKLKMLGLSFNSIKKIPPQIGELKQLKKLSLHDNRITKIPKQLLNLNIEFRRVGIDGGIIIYNNPIAEPPIEIIGRGRDSILAYFNSLENDKNKYLNELKVLLVGDGSVGKTSLVKRITENEFDVNEPQTMGIKIKRWAEKNQKNNINIHFWDFGGQEIMHATHQLFLSKRSLYVLVSRPKSFECFYGNAFSI